MELCIPLTTSIRLLWGFDLLFIGSCPESGGCENCEVCSVSRGIVKGWTCLKDVKVSNVLDDLWQVALYLGPGVAKQGEGGPAGAPPTAIARLVLRNW